MATETEFIARKNAEYIANAAVHALAVSTLKTYSRNSTVPKGKWDAQAKAYLTALDRAADAEVFCDVVRAYVRKEGAVNFPVDVVMVDGKQKAVVTLKCWVDLSHASGFFEMTDQDIQLHVLRFVKATGQTQSEVTFDVASNASGSSMAGTPVARPANRIQSFFGGQSVESAVSSFFGRQAAQTVTPVRTRVPAAHAYAPAATAPPFGRAPVRAAPVQAAPVAFGRAPASRHPQSPQAFYDPEPEPEPEQNVTISGAEAKQIREMLAMLQNMGVQARA